MVDWLSFFPLVFREVLRVCAECHELSVPVRRAEKRVLNDLNKQVRYPPPKKEIVRTPADKVRKEIGVIVGCSRRLHYFWEGGGS